MFVGLRFPTPAATLADVIERRSLCLAAQRQADADMDVTAPHGVEIVFMQSPVAAAHINDIIASSDDPVFDIANLADRAEFMGEPLPTYCAPIPGIGAQLRGH